MRAIHKERRKAVLDLSTVGDATAPMHQLHIDTDEMESPMELNIQLAPITQRQNSSSGTANHSPHISVQGVCSYSLDGKHPEHHVHKCVTEIYTSDS
jgi:hypothetical protein